MIQDFQFYVNYLKPKVIDISRLWVENQSQISRTEDNIFVIDQFNYNIYYMQEGNSITTSVDAKLSSETVFSLRKSGVSSTCVSMSVDFSPQNCQPSQENTPSMSSPLLRSIPIFNTDRNFFTPSFILQVEKGKYIKNQRIYKQLFEQKVQQIDQQSSQMYLPRPSKNNSFCCVCKMIFDDYLTHVNLPLHKTFMQKSEFYAEIKTVCEKFVQENQKNTNNKTLKRQPKTKVVKKQPKTPKKTKKAPIDSTSATRVHSMNELLLQGIN